ncbi:hypothetical protein [Saccharothrix lopnurensis]|uniref:ABM domain-containing protein n=1 Tax=Saccharothrix lopnurensis TaxID=1670621 RepID=A0ABW1PIJ1_9PSEU
MSTIETIRFRLRDDVETEDFIRRNRYVETEYMERRPGFQSRETAVSEDGEWMVSVHWATVEDAEATIGAFFGASETQDFLAAIDLPTVSSGRYQRVGR